MATLGAIGSFVGGATGIAAFASSLFTQTNSNNKKRWSLRTLLEIAIHRPFFTIVHPPPYYCGKFLKVVHDQKDAGPA
ncbi:MAG: hypothetical protein WA728_15125 [Xanthobacteraceae bacterium]